MGPLNKACSEGNLNVVKSLVEGKADINQVIGVRNPLCTAAAYGELGVVKYLIEEGKADIQQACKDEDEDGNTPLQEACGNYDGSLDIVKYLIEERKEDINQSAYRSTPLLLASGEGNLDIVKYLIEGKANVNKAGYSGYTPLHAASIAYDFTVVKYLIEEGKANVNLVDTDGRTPLILACDYYGMPYGFRHRYRYTFTYRCIALLYLLVFHGAIVPTAAEYQSRELSTALSMRDKVPLWLQEKEQKQALRRAKEMEALDFDWCLCGIHGLIDIVLSYSKEDPEDELDAIAAILNEI